ncbi:MAG: hypothetical protein IMHGJWDQ_000217, partial [Candidatus Fervidibacter sp.]
PFHAVPGGQDGATHLTISNNAPHRHEDAVAVGDAKEMVLRPR